MLRETVRRVGRPVYQTAIRSRLYGALVHRRSVSDLHGYWRNPSDGDNQPDLYLEGETKSRFLVGIIERYASRDASILELGCNVGRNLHYLHQARYRNLSAVEISQQAVDRIPVEYPDTAATATVTVGALEDVLPTVADDTYDLVLSMAVLEHVHDDSAPAVCAGIARVARGHIVTVEDEELFSWRHYPRDYRRVFERLGWHQVEALRCGGVEGLGPHMWARVFTRPS